ncbi:hypothetical protein LX36DRAFT_348102 [Colletotrichum falcatum]|nr:hypothetical protein LX36DRAFT_348102 [Colletotrichum falcatum]
MLPPYCHARASNYVVSVVGSSGTFITLENGARIVRTKLDPGMMTVFQDSLHMMQNTGCGNATLISALSSEDAGTQNVANGLFDPPPSVVAAAFGSNPLSAHFAQLRRDIPAVGTDASIGTAECLWRCEDSAHNYVKPKVPPSRICEQNITLRYPQEDYSGVGKYSGAVCQGLRKLAAQTLLAYHFGGLDCLMFCKGCTSRLTRVLASGAAMFVESLDPRNV